MAAILIADIYICTYCRHNGSGNLWYWQWYFCWYV